MRTFEIEDTASKFDILLNLVETNEGLEGWNNYDSDLFQGSTMRGLLHFYHATLSVLAADDRHLDLPKIELLLKVEQQARRMLTETTDRPAYGRRGA
jgi:hypothetical protein